MEREKSKTGMCKKFKTERVITQAGKLNTIKEVKEFGNV